MSSVLLVGMLIASVGVLVLEVENNDLSHAHQSRI